MKKIKAILAAVLAAATLTACGGTAADTTTAQNTAEATSENTVETTALADDTSADTSAEIDYSTLSDEEIRQLMVERSLMTVGNTARMRKALTKAANGEEITVAYIGGSITEGMTAGAEKCWAKLTYDWLCAKYPDTKINYINAGMAGTPSTLGLIRSDRDVLAKGEPDILFIEFAVNDAQDTKSKQCYESLTRKFLERDNDTAVVLFFTVIKSGYTCEKHMSEIGSFYDLPMISLNNTLAPEFEAGRMVWEDYSDDESHPNEWGHELVAELIENYYLNVMDMIENGTADEEIPALPEESLNGTMYKTMKLVDSTSITADELGSWALKDTLAQFPNGWEYNKDTGNEPIKFTIDCKSLYLIFRAQNSERLGTVDVYIDGEKVIDVKGNMSSGWNNPEAQWIFAEDEVKTHTVEIKMAEGSEENYFWLMGIGYCD